MKMKMKIILPVGASLLVAVIIALLFIVNNSQNITTKIEKYCAKNNEISLSPVTSFDWDTAYVDYQVYMCGEEIKEKSGKETMMRTFVNRVFYRLGFIIDKF